MRWRLLVHPYFTGSVLVLAVNDHLLKGRAPGVVTGKLSDFAGVFLIAVVVTALTGRPRFACCVSGLGFVALKTVPLATVLAAPFLGGMTLRDPTDLLSLIMLYPAFRFADHGVPNVPERSIPRQLLVVSSATVAVLAMSATSCVRPATVDGFVVVDDGTVFARVYNETYTDEVGRVPAPRWARSQDGGSTWVRTSEEPSAPVSFAKEACSTNLGCFRLGDDRVEHSLQASGEYATAFAFSREQRERIRMRSERTCASHVDGYRAMAIVSRSDSDHVVVAMGTQGALHRSPDGQWTRVAVLHRQPVSLHGPSWLGDLSLAPLAAAALSPVIFMVGRRRSKAQGIAALALALAGFLGLLSLAGGLLFFGVDYVVAGPITAGLSVTVFIASIAYAQTGKSGIEVPPGSASVS